MLTSLNKTAAQEFILQNTRCL